MTRVENTTYISCDERIIELDLSEHVMDGYEVFIDGSESDDGPFVFIQRNGKDVADIKIDVFKGHLFLKIWGQQGLVGAPIVIMLDQGEDQE
jgi:hypothetical protein